jgi:hypothetical protein
LKETTVDHSPSISGATKVGRRTTHLRRRRWLRRNPLLTTAFVAVLLAGLGVTGSASAADSATSFEVASLDGSGNNRAHPTWGQLGRPYSRVANASYADGISVPQGGPNPRLISNRILNDKNQNIFSGRGVTQWGWQWGQWLDHNFGLALGGGESANIPFNANDPMESFRNDLGVISFTRDAAAPGTGTSTSNPRQHINTVSSYIDGFAVYSGSPTRLEWLRDGSVDGNVTNNAPTLMLPGGYLPTRDVRGDPASAPEAAVDGRLRATPNKARIAGDVRANENIGLTATHTLFAREHNRIVAQLPRTGLTDEQRFQIARRIVVAEIQYITYTHWLPAMGVRLPAYTGYKSTVDATLSTEFATVGFRAHSQVHGEFEIETDLDRYTPAQLDAFRAQGIKVEIDGDEVKVAVPLNVAFFNPALLQELGEGPVLKMLGGEPQYNNDEMFDNHMRSVLFQIPKAGHTTCIEPVDPDCFTGVTDLGAIDIARTKEHGIPGYNALRQAYGLPAKTSFRAITGESTEAFPRDPALTPGNEVNDPESLDFTTLRDKNGAPIALDSPVANGQAVTATRRTSKAARLKAVFGTVDKVDAFTGMLAEPKVSGSEFGELQQAMWMKQFTALRDGDRFFFGNDPVLGLIRSTFGIDYRRTLGQIVADNTDIPAAELRPNVFVVPADEPLEPGRVFAPAAGRCLNDPASTPTNGSKVDIFDCTDGAPAQGWFQTAAGELRVYADSNKCLDVFHQRTNPGADVGVWTCNGQDNQKFRFNADGTIVGVQSGLCLDRDSSGTSNRTRVQMWDCNTTDAQKWIR